MGFKLQLDDKAVERLLGGNTETEIELRNWVVQEFTKKHLKSIVADPSFQKFINEEKNAFYKYVESQIEKHVGKKTGNYPPKYEFTSEFLGKIRDEAINISNKLLTEASKTIEENIKNYLDDKLEYLIDKRVQQYIEAEIDRRVQEKINSIKNAL